VPRISAKQYDNLSAQRVPLIGREQDLQAAETALLTTQGRLLTLTGTGGCGKTRLALALASRVHPLFGHGVILVELATIADSAMVPAVVASAMGIRELPDEPLTKTVVRTMAPIELLLVLDNCEHLIDACASLTEELLDSCRRLRVLATSREPLRIPGERTWRVPSLALPRHGAGADELRRSPAVELFLERAEVETSDEAGTASALSTVGQICTRLDGMPLAIELAAARARVLSVEEIYLRLDDSIGLLVGGGRTAPSRQQALRSTLDWSYRLLDDKERAVFRRLAVFVDSCSLDAAEAVCADIDVSAPEVLDLVSRLVDKSLVVVEQRDAQARYRLLEPTKQYGHDLLVASGERDRMRRRHTMYYQAYAEARAYDTAIGGPRRFAAMNEQASEYPNIRGALAWAVEHREAQVGLSIAWSLMFFWQMYSFVSEGIQWVEQVLALPGAEERTYARAGALLSGGYLALLRGDLERAWTYSEEASMLGRILDAPEIEWSGTHFRGVISFARGDLRQAIAFLQEAVPVGHRCANGVPEGSSLGLMGGFLCYQGDYGPALTVIERGQQLARGDPWIDAWQMVRFAQAYLGLGALDKARSALESALAGAERNGQPHSLTPRILDLLGELEIASNNPRQAREWLVRGLEFRHASGERFEGPQTFDRLASLAALCADAVRAFTLAGASDRAYQNIGGQRTAGEQRKREAWLVPLREKFGAEAADALLATGRALDVDDATAFALSDPDASGSAKHSKGASPLTAREREVARLLARGFSNRQIADELVISLHTAQRHVENILSKLGLSSRTQAATWAIGQGLTDEVLRP
jgi:non-specific serine/threonine protein kinase